MSSRIRPGRFITTCLAAGVALTLTACGASLPGEPTSVTTTPPPVTVTQTAPTTTVTTTAAPATAPTVTTTEPAPPPPTVTVTQIPPSTERPEPEPEPPSGDEEIRATTGHAFTVVNTYWSDVFGGWPPENGHPIVWWEPSLLNGDGFYDSDNGNPYGCDGEFLPGNAAFCPDGRGSGTVSWDLALLREEDMFGDGPIYATVAHEEGHAAQARFRYDNESGASPPRGDTLRTELQADCLAGATIAKAQQDGYLTLTPDQVRGIALATRAENTAGDHGTDDQRVAAFDLGHGTGNVETCLYNKGVSPHPSVI